MDDKKWKKYLRIPDEHPATSENQQNMEHYGKHMIQHTQVLDVGCGTGMLVNWLRGKGTSAKGCTVVQKEINIGKNRYGQDLPIELGDMHELPFGDGTIDAIHCKDVLEHAIAPYIALCEFNRVLKPGGFMLIVQPGEEWIECEYHYAWMYERQMREMMKKTKFVVDRIESGKPPKGGTIFYSYFCHKDGEVQW